MRLCRILLLVALVPLTAAAQTSPQRSQQSPQRPAAAQRTDRPPVVRPTRPSQPRPAAQNPTRTPRPATPGAAAGAAGGAAAGAAAAPRPAEPPPPAAPAVPERPAEPPRGSVSGLPIPRFAALRADEVNMRAGPGTRYPVQWVYQRRDLPVEIMREFEVWRLVRDPDGVQGWVHAAVLTGRRSFIVRGEEQPLRRAPEANAQTVARLKGGVVGRVRTCEPGTDWCQVQVGDHRGYLPREAFWGTYRDEAVN